MGQVPVTDTVGTQPGDQPATPRTPRIVEDVRRSVASTVDAQKDKAVTVVHRLAGAVGRAADELHQHDETLGEYARSASDGLRRWADDLGRKGSADVARDVSDFARRRPAIFVGGAFLLGLGLARFLRSRGDAQPSSGRPRADYARAGIDA